MSRSGNVLGTIAVSAALLTLAGIGGVAVVNAATAPQQPPQRITVVPTDRSGDSGDGVRENGDRDQSAPSMPTGPGTVIPDTTTSEKATPGKKATGKNAAGKKRPGKRPALTQPGTTSGGSALTKPSSDDDHDDTSADRDDDRREHDRDRDGHDDRDDDDD